MSDSWLSGLIAGSMALGFFIIAALVVGLICGIVGIVRGATSHRGGVLALGIIAVVFGVLGFFFLPLLNAIVSLVCGLVSISMRKKRKPLSYEEFQQQKRAAEDPDYAEYLRQTGQKMTLDDVYEKADKNAVKIFFIIVSFIILIIVAFFGFAAYGESSGRSKNSPWSNVIKGNGNRSKQKIIEDLGGNGNSGGRTTIEDLGQVILLFDYQK
jgi:hypothetical protein